MGAPGAGGARCKMSLQLPAPFDLGIMMLFRGTNYLPATPRSRSGPHPHSSQWRHGELRPHSQVRTHTPSVMSPASPSRQHTPRPGSVTYGSHRPRPELWEFLGHGHRALQQPGEANYFPPPSPKCLKLFTGHFPLCGRGALPLSRHCGPATIHHGLASHPPKNVFLTLPIMQKLTQL